MQLDPPVDRARLLEGRATAAELALLDRLIISRLVALEAATMGLGDLPEIRKQVDVFSRETLREVLLEDFFKDVTVDDKAVEAAYRDLVREWQTSSLLFKDEATARRAQEEIAGGAAFDVVAARLVADKTAQAQEDDAFHTKKDYLPEIASALAALEVGQVSPVIRIDQGFVVVKVLDIRYPENEAARARAQQTVLRQKRGEAVAQREEALRAERVTINQEVFDGLDYGKDTVDNLLKDTRTVAEIKGANPVTVGDLTDYMRLQLFHGEDPADTGRLLNTRKTAALDTVVRRRLLNAEAVRRGIDKSDAYLDRVNAFEESLVFGAFVEKVIAPDSKLVEEDVRADYDAHLKDYTGPAMMRLRAVPFVSRTAAEEAMRKLREGADYGWLLASAEGQVDRKTEGLLAFGERPVTTDSLPEGLRKVLADAKNGDVRLFASPEGPFYVVTVQEIIPSDVRPFDDVKEEIARRLYGVKLRKGVEDYAAKLRAQSKIEIHLTKID
jgi:parvulin-like peptidyl-prolyl isomerase